MPTYNISYSVLDGNLGNISVLNASGNAQQFFITTDGFMPFFGQTGTITFTTTDPLNPVVNINFDYDVPWIMFDFGTPQITVDFLTSGIEIDEFAEVTLDSFQMNYVVELGDGDVTMRSSYIGLPGMPAFYQGNIESVAYNQVASLFYSSRPLVDFDSFTIMVQPGPMEPFTFTFTEADLGSTLVQNELNEISFDFPEGTTVDLPEMWNVSFVYDYSEGPLVGDFMASSITVEQSENFLLTDISGGTDSKVLFVYPEAGKGDLLPENFLGFLEEAPVGASVGEFYGLTTDRTYYVVVSEGTVAIADNTDFDAQGYSTKSEASCTYGTVGTKSVTMYIMANEGEDTVLKEDYITVSELAYADFEADQLTAFVGAPIQFTDLSVGSYDTWSWDFGDTVGTSELQNPEYSYDFPGIYSVSLTVNGISGEYSEFKDQYITIIEPVEADFEADKTNLEIGEPVTFIDLSTGGATNFDRDFGVNGGPNILASTEEGYEGLFNDIYADSRLFWAGGSKSIFLKQDGGVWVLNMYESSLGDYTLQDFSQIPFSITTAFPIELSEKIFFVGDSGNKLYVLGGNGISQFDLDWELGTMTLIGTEILPAVYDSCWISDDGTKFYGIDSTGISQGTLSTPFDFSTFTADYLAEITGYSNISMSPNGETLLLWRQEPTLDYTIEQYKLTTAYDLVTVEETGNILSIPMEFGFTNLFVSVTTESDKLYLGGFTALPAYVVLAYGLLYDGKSKEQNPTYSYDTDGTYTVSLTASNEFDTDTETKVDYITVVPSGVAPIAYFEAIPEELAFAYDDSGYIDLYDLSTGEPTSWEWNIGGEIITDQNPRIEFGPFDKSMIGIYELDVSLTVSNDFGEDTKTIEGYLTIIITDVVPAPVAEFYADIEVGENPLTVQFVDDSYNLPTRWLWDFGEGFTTTFQNPEVTFYIPGKYTVSLTARNAAGTNSITKPDFIDVEPVAGAENLANIQESSRGERTFPPKLESTERDKKLEPGNSGDRTPPVIYD